jgi:PhnB protein
MQINAYLTFGGNCREAMTFYKQCLGGELSFQTVGDSAFSGIMPANMKNYVLNATLRNEFLVLMASDMVGNDGLIRGNTISLMVNCKNENEAKRCYQFLSEGGEPTNPLNTNLWGALFGDLTDRYGNHWLIVYQPERISVN